MEPKAVVAVLWIGERKPDLFSWLIQKFLRTNYSHNAILFDGVIWHGSTSDDPSADGFCSEPIERVLDGCVVRYCKTVVTRYTVAELRVYLEARRGTPYSMRQNIAAVRPFLRELPFIGRFFKTGKGKINCSEVVAEVCQGGFPPGEPRVLDFGPDFDLVKPNDTFRLLHPDLCDHNHLGT